MLPQGLQPGSLRRLGHRGSHRGLGCGPISLSRSCDTRAPQPGAAGPTGSSTPSLSSRGQKGAGSGTYREATAQEAVTISRLVWSKTLFKPQLRGPCRLPGQHTSEQSRPRGMAPGRRRREGQTSRGSRDRRGHRVKTKEIWSKCQLQSQPRQCQVINCDKCTAACTRLAGQGIRENCPRCSAFL